MPRNLDTRVELIVPVEDEAVRDDLLDAVERCLVDTAGAWDLGPEREWVRREQGPEPRSVQRELMLGHAARAAEASS
jgi:polyphosphate kinase